MFFHLYVDGVRCSGGLANQAWQLAVCTARNLIARDSDDQKPVVLNAFGM